METRFENLRRRKAKEKAKTWDATYIGVFFVRSVKYEA